MLHGTRVFMCQQLLTLVLKRNIWHRQTDNDSRAIDRYNIVLNKLWMQDIISYYRSEPKFKDAIILSK